MTINVGPVIQAGALGNAIVESIQMLNENVQVVSRGSYFRVLVPGHCVLTKAAIEKKIGGSFELPGDLEKVMCSFAGVFQVSETEALWSAEGEA